MEIRFVITNECNFDCYFCLKEYDIEQGNYNIDADGFSLISKVASNKLRINEITLTGGEPLRYYQFDKLVSNLHELKNKITVVTNGYYLNDKLHILELIDELHVSFHSFNRVHWKRITGTNSNAMQKVIKNIIVIRNSYPSLRIKLNVVSEKGNSQIADIQTYLNFARKYNLEISVFKESYTLWAKRMKIPIKFSREPEDFWDIEPFNPVFLKEDSRKRYFIVQDVKVTLSHTSADSLEKSSIWINQFGFAYSDIYRKSLTSMCNSIQNEEEQEIYNILAQMI